MIDFILISLRFLAWIVIFFIFLGCFIYTIIALVENKILTKKRFYIFVLIAFFIAGFIYNYLILSSSFLSGLEGGCVLMSIILAISTVVFLINLKQLKKPNN